MESAVPAQHGEKSAGENPLQVSYTLTRGDYIAWWLHHFNRTTEHNDRRLASLPFRLALMGLHVLLTFLIVWGLWFWYTFSGSEKDLGLETVAYLWIPFLLAESFLFLGTGPNNHFRRWARHRWIKANERQLGGDFRIQRAIQLTLLPEHFLEISEARQAEAGIAAEYHTETTVAWPSVERIDVTERHAFFILTPGNRALILPRHAFPDQAAFDRFVTTSEGFRREAVFTSLTDRSMGRPIDERIALPPGIRPPPPS